MKLACCILSVPFAFVLLWTQTAYADPFAGSYSLSVAYDNDISDGVVILRDSAVDLTITRNSPTELTASIAGEGGPVTIPLTESGQRVTASGAPIAYTGWNLIEFAMVSDGINKAFLMVGQDASDPTDMSIMASSWSEATEPVAATDIAGAWTVLQYSDHNLLDLDEGFEQDPPVVGTNVAISPDQIRLTALPPEWNPLSANLFVSGTIVSLINPPGDDYHLLRIATDGNTSAFCAVNVEDDDPTDVGMSIGLCPDTKPLLPGDTDLDADVDLEDLSMLAGNWSTSSGMTWAHGDFDGDADVDIEDLSLLAGNWGTGSAATVPEPASLWVLVAGCALCRRRADDGRA